MWYMLMKVTSFQKSFDLLLGNSWGFSLICRDGKVGRIICFFLYYFKCRHMISTGVWYSKGSSESLIKLKFRLFTSEFDLCFFCPLTESERRFSVCIELSCFLKITGIKKRIWKLYQRHRFYIWIFKRQS